MTSRNRKTLKNFFAEGQLPTSDHFGDLVDSMLNMSDEGFRKSPENGVEISTPVNYDALLSFYRDQTPKTVVWSISYGSGANEQLHFHPAAVQDSRTATPVLSLDSARIAADAGEARVGRVGINTATPQQTLDVGGVVAAHGRIGTYPLAHDLSLPADGLPHTLTRELHGCHAFEVMAGVGGHPGQGRYALLHAIALNAFNPDPGWFDFLWRKRRIRTTSAYYGRRCDQLALQWAAVEGHEHPSDAKYELQIRTKCDYGPGIQIKAHVTCLWFDETMQGPAESVQAAEHPKPLTRGARVKRLARRLLGGASYPNSRTRAAGEDG